MPRKDTTSGYDVGPIEPFNDRTRRRAEISALRLAYVGQPRENIARGYARELFDACGGDFYLTVYAAVQRFIASGIEIELAPTAPGDCAATTRKGTPCQRPAVRDGLCPSHQHLREPIAA